MLFYYADCKQLNFPHVMTYLFITQNSLLVLCKHPLRIFILQTSSMQILFIHFFCISVTFT